jgi:hypothetical protein
MKKSITFLFAFMMTAVVSLRAQEQQDSSARPSYYPQEEINTVFKSSPRARISGYGVISNKFTSIDGNYMNLSEIYGGVYLNRRVMIGVGGAASTNNLPVPDQFSSVEGRKLSYQYVQFGLYTEYVIGSNKAIHPVVHLFAGPGLTVQYDRHDWDDFDEMDEHENRDENWFMVAEPGVQIEINVFRWMRFSPGVSYRMAFGNDASGLSDSKLSGMSFNASLKFGRF